MLDKAYCFGKKRLATEARYSDSNNVLLPKTSRKLDMSMRRCVEQSSAHQPRPYKLQQTSRQVVNCQYRQLLKDIAAWASSSKPCVTAKGYFL